MQKYDYSKTGVSMLALTSNKIFIKKDIKIPTKVCIRHICGCCSNASVGLYEKSSNPECKTCKF